MSNIPITPFTQLNEEDESNVEKLMLILRGLPVYEQQRADINHVSEAAFVVSGGPPCLIREAIVVTHIHPEAPPQLLQGIEQARKLQNLSEYESALDRLSLVQALFQRPSLWSYLRQHPAASLEDGLAEEKRREERRERYEERERERRRRAAEEEKKAAEDAARQEQAENEQKHDSDEDWEDEEEEEQKPAHQKQASVLNKEAVPAIQTDISLSDDPDEPLTPDYSNELVDVTEMDTLYFNLLYHNLQASILLSRGQGDAIVPLMRAIRVKESWSRYQQEVLDAEREKERLARKKEKKEGEGAEEEEEEEALTQRSLADSSLTANKSSPQPLSLTEQLDVYKSKGYFNFEAAEEGATAGSESALDQEQAARDVFWSSSSAEPTAVSSPSSASNSSPDRSSAIPANHPALLHPYNFAFILDGLTYSQLSIACYQLHNLPLALRCCHVSLQIRLLTLQPSSMEYIDCATCFNNFGVYYCALKQYTLAAQFFKAAQELITARLDPLHPRCNLVRNNLNKIQSKHVELFVPHLLMQLQSIQIAKARKEYDAWEKTQARLKKQKAKGEKMGSPAASSRTARGKKDEEKPKEFWEDTRFFQEPPEPPKEKGKKSSKSAANKAKSGKPGSANKGKDEKEEEEQKGPPSLDVQIMPVMPLRHWDVQMGEMQSRLLEFGAAKKKKAGGGDGSKKKKSKKKKK